MNKGENMALLACLVRYPDLFEEVYSSIGDKPLFNRLVDPVSDFIWESMRSAYADSNVYPTEIMVRTAVANRSDTDTSFDLMLNSMVEQDLDKIYAGSEGKTSEAVGKYFAERAIHEARTIDWSERIKAMRTTDELQELIGNITTEVNTINKMDMAALTKPLLHADRFLVHRNKHPLGVRVIDLLVGGGMSPGELLGVLGPTGGGKTVLAVGIACEQTRRKKHVAIFQFEQPTEGDLTERIFSYMLNTDISQFRNKNLKDIDKNLLKQYGEIKEKFGKYLTIVDLSQGSRGQDGANEVIRFLDSLIANGECPNVVIIDWLGAMIQRYIAFKNLNTSDYRHIAQQFIDVVRQHARTHGYIPVFFHQLNTEAARRSPQVKPVVTDAMEVRSFAFFMDACVCLGTLSKDTRVGWFIADKNRRDNPVELLVKLEGARVRFTEAQGYSVDHRGRFISEEDMLEAQAVDGGPGHSQAEDPALREYLDEAF